MDIQFANPLWFWGLLGLIPLVCLRLWAHFHAAKRLPGLVSPRLRTRLISGGSQFQRWLVFTFLAISLACLITALARPQWGFEESETESEGRNLFIAIDTSRSMLATDLLPNRMLRAKLAAKDILAALPEDRIGLIAFAGRAFLQAPLTVDHDAVAEAIDQLDTDIIPRGGTNLTAATEVALEALEESFLEESALVIFSDGEALEGKDQIDTIKEKANTAGMTIVTVGVGTPGGAIIPEIDSDTGAAIPGVFIKDDNGQVVRTRLDEAALRSLASGNGAYIQLGSAVSLAAVIERITSTIATSRQEEQARSRPIERFMWPLGAATGFMILSFLTPLLFLKRRPKPAVIEPKASLSPNVGIALLLLVSASASRGADTMREGFEAFQRGEYDQAIKIYRSLESKKTSSAKEAEIQISLGASAYQKADFEAAETSFSKSLTAPVERLRGIAHYNLANTLFRKGETMLKTASGGGNPDQLQQMNGSGATVESTIRQWESAIEHYESAIAQNSHGDKAAFNIEVVKKRIEELKKESEEQESKEGESGDQEDGEGGDESDQDKSKDGESDSENPDEEESKDGENESEEQENPEEKDQQTEHNSGQEDESSENEQEQPQTGEEEESAEPEPPQDGKLEANPSEPQETPQPSQEQMQQLQQRRNPETGYSRSEARQLLEALADETEVRPEFKPAPNEKFKDW